MVNKVILLGNLGQDPDLRYTAGGTAVANLSMATSEKYKDQSGEWVEKTEWHRLTAWGRTAEICGEYLSKGSRIYIEGKLQTRKWTDKEGNDRYTTEVVVREMKMLGDRNQNGQGGQNGQGQSYGRPQGQSQAYGQQSHRPASPPPPDDFEDDIPF